MRSSVRAFVGLVASAQLLLWGGAIRPARAAAAPAEATPAAPLIALLVQDPEARWIARLAAEIRSVGFDVTIVPTPRSSGPLTGGLEEAARAAGAIAAVRLLPTQDGIEVWIADRVTGKTVMRRVLPPNGGGSTADAVLAVRAVELLRGSLLELRRSAPVRGDVPAPPQVRALVAAEEREATKIGVGLWVAPGWVMSAGGVPGAGVLEVGGLLAPSARFALELWLGLPVRSAALTRDEATARMDVGLVGAGARLVSHPFGQERWGFSAGGGAGAVWLRLSGQPGSDALRPRTDDVAAAIAYGRFGVTCALARWIALTARADVGAALPWPAVAFGGTRVADWGLPFGVVSLGVEAALP